MNAVLGWVALPLVLYLLGLGLGLVAEWAARVTLADELLAPVGFCLAICLVMPVYKLGQGSLAAGIVVVLVAALGLWARRRDLRRRGLPRWGLVAGLGAYLLYLAPVLASGHWTWLGYNFVNDTSVNFVFADQVAHHGLDRASGLPSTTTAVAASIQDGYPVASHGLLVALTALVRAPIEVVYQPFIAGCAGLAAMGLVAVARRVRVPPPAAAAAAFTGVAASLLYDYAAHGAIKEVAVLVTIVAAAALAGALLDADLHPGFAGLIGLTVAAGLAIFGAVAAAYGGVLAVTVLVAVVVERLRPGPVALVRAGAVAALALLVVSLPTLSATITFGRFASNAFSGAGGLTGPNSPEFLGHLVRALPVGQVAGIWPTEDYRFPLPSGRHGVAVILIAVVFAALGLAVAREVWRRRLGALLLLAPAVVTWVALAPRLSPYADAKLELIASPIVVFAAGLGLAGLSRRVPSLAAALAVAIAGGVLWSDAIAYHVVRTAPPARMAALTDAARHADGSGLWLLNEWEEFGKYFMRKIRVNAASESLSPRPVVLRRPRPIFGQYFDLDEQTLAYVESFPGIIKRRAADGSRPPANFRLTHRNGYYEVWRRSPSPRVLEHLPLQGVHQPARHPSCARVRRMAARVRPGERLLAARRPELFELQSAGPARSPGWVPHPFLPAMVIPTTPGRADGEATLGGGTYRVSLNGTSGRPLTALIDGRRVGQAVGVNTPGQWLDVATIELAAGTHAIGLTRPGGDLRPGDGYRGEIGPLALERVGDIELVDVRPAGAATTLCGRDWDWIERVRGG